MKLHHNGLIVANKKLLLRCARIEPHKIFTDFVHGRHSFPLQKMLRGDKGKSRDKAVNLSKIAAYGIAYAQYPANF